MSVPQTMLAIKCSENGGPEVMEWSQHPVPLLNNHEVLIQVVTAGLNRADILQRQGRYPPPEGTTQIMGLEVAGVVAAIGCDVTQWKKGDHVCALLSGGGYAEYVAVHDGQCFQKPPHLSWAEAAALPEALITVWANLFELGDLKPHETVLFHGGSSGIGSFAIPMVKLWGAHIFVTAGSDEKCRACDSWGADLSINYKTHDFVEVIQRVTQGKGVDIVVDMVGGDYISRNLSLLSERGRHVSIATQQGKSATVDLRQIMQKRLIVTGSTLRSRTKDEKARLVNKVTENVVPWVIQGRLKPFIYKTLPIKNVGDAHKMMEIARHIGKIVLEVHPTL